MTTRNILTYKIVLTCYAAASQNGWHDLKALKMSALEHRAAGIAYTYSEVFEMLSAREKGLASNFTAFEAEENKQEAFKKHVKGTEQDEFADVVIRLADLLGFCQHHGLGLGLDHAGFPPFDRPSLMVAHLLSQAEGAEYGLVGPVLSLLDAWQDAFKTFQSEADLLAHVGAKLAYNKSRGQRHGKVV